MDAVPALPATPRSGLLSAAPTLTQRKGGAGAKAGELLAAGAGRRERRSRACEYRALRLLGDGGFGQVYLARRLGRSSVVPARLCIKVSERIDAWLREAYFGQLLDGHPRAIRVFDAFPLVRPDGRLLYCLALEYARHGDLRAFLHRTGKGWPERTARREIAGILQVLGKLHRGQVLHRDLTPMNVFVCEGRSLKLGDFGLVRQQSDRRGTTADALNPLMAPSDIVAGAVPKWQSRDDVYQVGQLLGMLVRGRRAGADPHRRDPPSPVQRPAEGDRPPLHRRAPQALRERRRADRGAAQAARLAEGRAGSDR